MQEYQLRRMVPQTLISRAQNEEELAIKVVARDPKRFLDYIKKMNAMTYDREKKAFFEKMDRDDQLGFVFLALNPRKNIDKVMDYLALQAQKF